MLHCGKMAKQDQQKSYKNTMHITPIKTKKVVAGETLFAILTSAIASLSEYEIVIVTSKIVSICEGSIVSIRKVDKQKLIEKSADFFISQKENLYGTTITIKNNILIAASGIDESNGNGYHVFWPKNPQKSANAIRAFLQKKFHLKNIGVIITDSRTSPLRWGTTGISLAHSGFLANNNFVGKKDLFGRELHITNVNVIDSLAAAAVVVMGETTEQTPLAVIRDIPFVHFRQKNPSKKEVSVFHRPMEKDLYAPILTKANWQKGKK